MKKTIALLLSVTMCLWILTGCESMPSQPQNGSSSDDLLSGWSVVSGSDGYFDNSQTVVEKTENTVSADLSGVPATKLMQVNFEKIYKSVITPGEKYYRTSEGEAIPYSGADSIPDGLSKEIGDAIIEHSDEALITGYKTGTELTQEQFISMAGASNGADTGFTYTSISADADNDGIDDIIALADFGGTSGFGELQVYKGNGQGYRLTDTFSAVAYDYSVLNYNGKNYICQKQYDYETKYFLGYMILCCADGVFAAQELVSLYISDYGVSISYEDGSFAGIDDIRSTLVNKNIPKIFSANNDVIYGTSEEVLEKYYRFKCDIDNDGVDEIYEKMMHYPSNMISFKYCYWYYFDENDDLIDDFDDKLFELYNADTDIADNIFMFWVDKIGDKNVTYFYTDSADRFVLSAYIIG